MLQKNILVLLLIIGIVSGCSDKKEDNSIVEELAPSAFENAFNESKELVLLIKNNVLILDSTTIEALIVSHNLKPEGDIYRSEISFGNIALKKVFKCNKGVINTVHFDFYYDSLNTELQNDSKSLLGFLQKELGDYTSTHSSSSMKTHTWTVSGNIIDYELFENGFTFTIRKNHTSIKPIVSKQEVSEQLKLTDILINHIYNDSISFESSSMSGIQSLFDVDFKGKSNALAFSKTYNENILLSGSFLFDQDVLSGIYFDYMYSDTTSKDFVSDAKIVKSMISELFNAPSEVATVSVSSSYKWINTPIILEVYGDGFSVILEKSSL